MEIGATEELQAFILDLRSKAASRISDVEAIIASRFEAGRDGFWLPRLTARGPDIRAKTDRLDAKGSC